MVAWVTKIQENLSQVPGKNGMRRYRSRRMKIMRGNKRRRRDANKKWLGFLSFVSGCWLNCSLHLPPWEKWWRWWWWKREKRGRKERKTFEVQKKNISKGFHIKRRKDPEEEDLYDEKTSHRRRWAQKNPKRWWKEKMLKHEITSNVQEENLSPSKNFTPPPPHRHVIEWRWSYGWCYAIQKTQKRNLTGDARWFSE